MSRENPERPNILYFITHDQGDTVHCLGWEQARTPNLDRLASQGARFTNHFCATMCCSPARGALMTGRHAHANGLMGLVNRGIVLPQSERTAVDYLNDAGYHTCQIGLQHERMRDQNHYRELGTEKVNCGTVCRDVADWLRAHKDDDQPFYLNAGTFEVHAPWTNPHYQNRYTPEEVEIPSYLVDTPEIRNMMATYLGSVAWFDECYGQVLDALEETGLAENTIVVFTTDHGISFPARAKGTCYEAGLRTCMFIRWDGHIEANLEMFHLASGVDLLPTLLEMVGLEPADNVHGYSHAAFLLGQPYTPQEHIFAEHNFHAIFDPVRVIRGEQYKLIHNFSERSLILPAPVAQETYRTSTVEMRNSGIRRPPLELYDIQEDPIEMRNLAYNEEYREIVETMSARLDEWRNETGDYLRGAFEFCHLPRREDQIIPGLPERWWREQPFAKDALSLDEKTAREKAFQCWG
ncbi:sulfatase [bacterium]|nr:sulfatase [bacterium]